MTKKNGRILLTMKDPGKCEVVDEQALAETLLKVEIYLNDKVALQVFQKFGVLLRVHL